MFMQGGVATVKAELTLDLGTNDFSVPSKVGQGPERVIKALRIIKGFEHESFWWRAGFALYERRKYFAKLRLKRSIKMYINTRLCA